jgi:hypothetical protein
MWYKLISGENPREEEGTMVKATDIKICTEESCDFLPCLIARRDVAAEELRAAASWDQPSAFRKYVDCARAVRRGEEEEARFLAAMDDYAAEVVA